MDQFGISVDNLMQIIFDYASPPGSLIEGRHFIETTPGMYFQVTHPTLGVTPVDVIQYIKALHLGTIPIAGTGWDVITKHPTYPGQTRLAALLGEIVRLNDAAARTVLGV